MISSRHLIDDNLYSEIIRVSKEYGYKAKGVNSWQKFISKLLAYSIEHPDIFRR